jgi:hypothetical protein
VATARSTQDALAALARSYVDTWLARADFAVVYARESTHLDPRDRAELIRLQRLYVAIWVELLRTAAPALSAADARLAVHAALAIANDIALTPEPVGRNPSADDLTALLLGVLTHVTAPDGASR